MNEPDCRVGKKQDIMYKDYLKEKGYSLKSVPTYIKAKDRFNQWCKKYGTTATEIDYKTFLQYIQHLKTTRIKPRTLKNYINNQSRPK